MSKHSSLSAMLSLRARESSRRRGRDRKADRKPDLKPHLKVESLEPRLALATGLLSTLVSVVRDDASHSLLAPGTTTKITEGEQLTASVRLTRKPDSAILVSFKNPAALEVGAPLTTLRFTRATWNQPQTVSFASLQDGSRDGDHVVPVKMKTAVARNPQSKATKTVRIESLDSGVVTPDSPVTATQKGSIFGGGNTGSVVGTYDAGKNLGTATFKVTMPGVKHVRNRTITVDYSVNPDSTVKVERLEGIPREKFRLDATHRRVGVDHGLFGTLTVMQPKLGQSATAMMTVAAVPDAVQNLAVTPTGVGSLLLSWNPPAGGATSYTVTINNGSTTTTSTTTATSMPFTGLSAGNSYTFTVVAINAAGNGPTSRAEFQAGGTINVGSDPDALAGGADQSIWVANKSSNGVQQIVHFDDAWKARPAISVGNMPRALTSGLDGSLWVASQATTGNVQQLVDETGAWQTRSSFTFGGKVDHATYGPTALTTGLDGSIWFTISATSVPSPIPLTSPAPGSHSPGMPAGSSPDLVYGDVVQQITNVNGTWTSQPPIRVGSQPCALATGADGSIWVANPGSNTVQRIANVNGGWTAQPAVGVGKSPQALTTGLDGTIWVANVSDKSVQRIANINGVWTAQPAISVDGAPAALTTGVDGSIWVASEQGNNVQQITIVNGEWKAQPAIVGPKGPVALTAGVNGAIWVACSGDDVVDQLVFSPMIPRELAAIVGPGPGEVSLGWTPAPNGGSPIISYTVTAYKGTTTETVTTSSTSCTFSGLPLGQTTTYFTVVATSFVGVSPTASLWLSANGSPIDSAGLAMGIVADGTPITDGGFDGDGNAYSWEALGSSPTLAWNGVTFHLASPNQPNCTIAAGQTIPVPQGAYTTLNLAGAAVNGSQTNQQITLTFTDNSTVTWTQSFSDWGNPQNYGHEAIVSTQSYRDTASGGTEQFTNHVYGYSYTIPTGKTLASITLPKNQNVRLLDLTMSNSTSVDLSGAYTSWGIANGSTQVANHQGFDGGGYYYYSGNLQSTIAWGGATFNFGPVPTSKNGQSNFVQAKGQRIDLPKGDYGWLYLAGAAANGSQESQELYLNFADGSIVRWTQSFSDWCSSSGYTGETIIQMQPNWVNQVGNVHSKTNYVYGYAFQIPAGKTLESITLPNNTNLGILGIALMRAPS